MTNIKALDKDNYAIEIAADGNGSPLDPFIPHHKVASSVLPVGAAVETKQVEQLARIQELLAVIEDSRDLLQILINLSGTVSVSNFPATQTVSGIVGVNNFPVIQTVSGAVGINNFPANQSIIDSQITYTESMFALAANGAFNGVGRDAQNRNTVRGWVWTNTNGILYIDQSTNNTTWRQIEAIPITGNTAQATDYLFRLVARYYRLRYVNGNNAQSSFELISTVFGIGL